MDLWQTIAADEMAEFIKDYLPVNGVCLTGSVMTPGALDIFSDVDMKIQLSDNKPVNFIDLAEALSERFCKVFGYEVHNNDNSDVFRVCFVNGWRFDLTFSYPKPQKPVTFGISFSDKIYNAVNQFWFLSSMVLVKLGRYDYLVAAHLVLELCQLNIVIQMLIRDEEKKTSIHKFGDREDVPVLRSLTSLNKYGDTALDTKDEILGVLFLAAEYMDKISANAFPEYINRNNELKALYHLLFSH